jgi:predicted NAD-dependent protein-ADP-ribosyltransferase YbiA (DUF1768 family)
VLSPPLDIRPYDRIWGVGYGEKDAEANRQKWGQNLLGKAITRVRITLSQEKGDSENTLWSSMS